LRADYVKLRRGFAQTFARDALKAVELDASLLNPSNNTLSVHRAKFHPKLPLCLEGILALNILSVYEYAQRGSLCTMSDRANEALTSAMKLSLHESLEEDEYAEARRRTWWMTVSFCQHFGVSLDKLADRSSIQTVHGGVSSSHFEQHGRILITAVFVDETKKR
jgi:hypothetical protein